MVIYWYTRKPTTRNEEFVAVATVDTAHSSCLSNKLAYNTCMSECNCKFKGAGGTPGGVGMFFLGLALASAGGWALTNQVTVSDGYFAAGYMIPVIGYQVHTFGLSLVPFILGIMCLFYNAKSLIGWILGVGGFAIIIAGILMTLHIQFRPTTLFHTLVMLVMLFGGIGLILRSFRSVCVTEPTENKPDQSAK